MTSEERRENRYQRRKQKRSEKEYEFALQFDNFNNVSNIDILLKSSYKAKQSANWKTNSQKFHINLLKNCIRYSDKLEQQENIHTKTVKFVISERGKIRNISSIGFPEKVVQKVLTTNVVYPLLTHNLIYDNGSSIKNKGYDFSIKRLKNHLTNFYKENNSNNGYVLLIDLKNYFGSIPHEKLKEEIKKRIHDEKVLYLLFSIIDDNNTEYGLQLGYEVDQILAVYYPNSVDHYIKDQCGFKYYGRYQDDSYVIHNSKEELEKLLSNVTNKYDELGLKVHPNKTKIINISSSEFTYLKNRVKLDKSGKVVMRPDKKSIKRIRVKLGKFKKMYDNGDIFFDEVNNYYQSCRGYLSRKDAYYTVKSLDKLFYDYFVKGGIKRKKKERNYNNKNCNTIQEEFNLEYQEIEEKMNKRSKNKAIVKYEN